MPRLIIITFAALLTVVTLPTSANAQMSPAEAQRLLDQKKRGREAREKREAEQENHEQAKPKDNQQTEKLERQKEIDKQFELDPHRWVMGIQMVPIKQAQKTMRKSDDPDMRRQAVWMPSYGVFIVSVFPGSPADKANLEPGSIILRVNGKRVEGSDFSFDLKEKNKLIVATLIDKRRWDHNLYEIDAVRKNEFFRSIAKKDEDDVDGRIVYSYPDSPEYVNSRCAVFPVIIQNKDERFLALKIDYLSDDWLFMHKVTLADKGSDWKTDFDFTIHSVNRDNSAYRIWEWTVLPLERNQLEQMDEHAGNMLIRYEGDEYIRDVKLNEADAKAMQFVLHLWDELEREAPIMKKPETTTTNNKNSALKA